MRIILERLECSFARQEAKLDRVLSMVESTCPQTQFSTPNPTPSGHCHSLEYTPTVTQRTSLPEVDRLLQDHNLTGT